jgi:hypothetical protein
MPFPNNITSYPDCQKLFDQALASERGIKVTWPSTDEAIFQAGRLNAFRVRHRKANGNIYPADHPLHAASEYDAIMVRRDDNVVELVKLSNTNLNVEEL